MLCEAVMKMLVLLSALYAVTHCAPSHKPEYYTLMVRGTIVAYDCKGLPGNVTRPKEIYNSEYYIGMDGKLCCPLNANYCIPRERVDEECQQLGRGVVYEPCFHCFTCAQKIGENCRGPEGSEGQCDQTGEERLQCIGTKDHENKTGVCAPQSPSPKKIGEDCGGRLDSLGSCEDGLVCWEVREGANHKCVMADRLKQWNETCGGSYGAKGRCDGNERLRCSVPERKFLIGDDICGYCYDSALKSNCFSNCSTRRDKYECGTDGVWYRHRCYYKQKNCGLHNAYKIGKAADDSTCGEKPTSPPIVKNSDEDEETATEKSVESRASIESSSLQHTESTQEEILDNNI